MTKKTRQGVAPVERIGALRNRLEELRNHGTGGNVTLDILIELTEIVASLAAHNGGALRSK
jgi:hypothetical protein